MIIACEQCDTRFQLDDSRIPPKGARVRCSRCKHAFFVPHPGLSVEEVIEEVVAEATDPSLAALPEATQDLGPAAAIEEESPFDAALPGPGHTDPDVSSSLAPVDGSAQPDFEEDWEFNEDPPSRPAAEAEAPAASADPVQQVLAKEAAEGSLEDLGSPEDWDFLDGEAGKSGRKAAAVETGEPESEAVSELEELAEVAADVAGDAAATPSAKPPRVSARRSRGLSLRGFETGLHGLAWAGAVALVGIALAGMLSAATRPHEAVRAENLEASVERRVASEVRGRYLDNAIGGAVYVVSGLYEGPAGPYQALQIQLTDAEGRPLGAAWAGPEVGERSLREDPPAELRSRLARESLKLSESRGARGFDAIFEQVPPEAAGLRLTIAPAPPDARASRPPSPIPSSE